MIELSPSRLARLADDIHMLYERGRHHAEEAFECKLAIGHRILEARELHPSDQAFGKWFDAQKFPFSRVWAWKLREAAANEDAVRAAVVTQVTTGGEPNIKAALEVVQRKERDAIEARARQVQVADVNADASGPGWRLLAGDFRDRLDELPDAAVDLIVTDPPYNSDDLELWSDLAKHATRILKPQGILAALSGQILLPAVIERLGEHLSYGWTYVQPLRGSNSRIMARHVLQAWKPWLTYSNGPWPSGQLDWHADTLEPGARTKDRYRWEQDPSSSAMLIDQFSPPNGVICDPMAGTGSFPLCGLRLGRSVVAVEADKTRCTSITQRLRALNATNAGSASPRPPSSITEHDHDRHSQGRVG